MARTEMGGVALRKLWPTPTWVQREDRMPDASVSDVRGSREYESAASETSTDSKAGRMKMPTPQFLEQRKAIILSDLTMKIEAEDWHGVADAAMDLREIEAQTKVIGPSSPSLPHSCQDGHDWRYYLVTGVESCQVCGAQRELQRSDAEIRAETLQRAKDLGVTL